MRRPYDQDWEPFEDQFAQETSDEAASSPTKEAILTAWRGTGKAILAVLHLIANALKGTAYGTILGGSVIAVLVLSILPTTLFFSWIIMMIAGDLYHHEVLNAPMSYRLSLVPGFVVASLIGLWGAR